MNDLRVSYPFELLLIPDLDCDYSAKSFYIISEYEHWEASWAHVGLIFGLVCSNKITGSEWSPNLQSYLWQNIIDI